MIRSEFNVDPWELSTEKFCELFTEASWLIQHRTRLLAASLGLQREE